MIRTFVGKGGILLFQGPDPSPAKVGRILAVQGAREIDWTGPIPTGTVWDGKGWIQPEPPEPTPQEEAGIRIEAGITLEFSQKPQLTGTYAIDLQAQANISGIVTSLNAKQGFPPGNADMLNYGDLAGVPHPFSQDEFVLFATLVRDYIYAIDVTTRTLATGAQAEWPILPVVVP